MSHSDFTLSATDKRLLADIISGTPAPISPPVALPDTLGQEAQSSAAVLPYVNELSRDEE